MAFAASYKISIILGEGTMGYQNGKELLPNNLLTAIQEYIDGDYLYIPRKESNKRPWGTNNQSKEYTLRRNREIFQQYLSGITVVQLADKHYLSIKTIYGIIAKMRHHDEPMII